jgi:hypothetical protein
MTPRWRGALTILPRAPDQAVPAGVGVALRINLYLSGRMTSEISNGSPIASQLWMRRARLRARAHLRRLVGDSFRLACPVEPWHPVITFPS